MLRFFLTCLLGSFLAPAALAQPRPAPEKSLVAVAQDRRAVVDFRANPVAVEAMVNALVKEVTGKRTVAEAWASLVQPEDRVGIKVATAGGRYFSTHPAVVAAVARGLVQAGVPRQNIIVWDRSESDLRAAGFLPPEAGYRVAWIEPRSGYDLQQPISGAVMGNLIWGDAKFDGKRPDSPWEESNEEGQISSTSYLPEVLTKQVTKVINLPVLSDDMKCGVAGCVYNMTVRNLDNWRRFLQPPAFGDPYLAELYADERIGGKVVLHIMDGLRAQYAYGPRFEPNYAFTFGTLYASRDPVAIDAIALRLIDGWRKEANLPGALRRGSYLVTAAQMGLGNYLEDQIDHRQVKPEPRR